MAVKDVVERIFRLGHDDPHVTIRPPDQKEEVKALVAEIKEEFERRRNERRPFELQWRLNQNFIAGNQYCDIVPQTGEIVNLPPMMDTEMMSVYNQLAPIIEIRLSKLSRVHPGLVVRPVTSDNSDIMSALVSTRLLKASYAGQEMKRKAAVMNAWAETCGGVFVKNTWNPRLGRVLGILNDRPIHEGDLSTTVVPYYEIFPKSSYVENLEDQDSIIHAKVYTVDEIRLRWGVDLPGQDMNVFSMDSTGVTPGGIGYNHSTFQVKDNTVADSELVLEYFEKPNADFPEGRHAIIAGDVMVHIGPLTYRTGEYYRPAYPFVHQRCLYQPGILWGGTVVERCIPLQRDYNAIKNRINEYMARMTIGNIVAEKGSLVDDSILENGLVPGAILEYMPGMNPPAWMTPQDIPQTLLNQADAIENQFVIISGVSEMARSSQTPAAISSGNALEVLKEQDDTRLALTAENIRDSYAAIGKQWLRLFKQFATAPRISRIIGDDFGDVYGMLWSANDITSDDVIVDTDNEMTNTPAQRKQLALELLQAGMFVDPDTGRMTRETRAKLLEVFEMGNTEAAIDLDSLQNGRARRENLLALNGMAPTIMELDNHPLHIAEHTKFALSADFRKLQNSDPRGAARFLAHLKQHKDVAAQQAMALTGQGAPQMVSQGTPMQTALNADAMNTGNMGAGQ